MSGYFIRGKDANELNLKHVVMRLEDASGFVNDASNMISHGFGIKEAALFAVMLDTISRQIDDMRKIAEIIRDNYEYDEECAKVIFDE